LRANVELQNESQRLINTQTQLKTTCGLARLLNLKPEQNVELADEVNFFQTPAITVDQSLKRRWPAGLKWLAARRSPAPRAGCCASRASAR
jgi:hypothetical protein